MSISAAFFVFAIAGGTVYLLVVGEPVLLPLVVAIFVWHLINALAGALGRIRLAGHAAPAWLRYGGAAAVLLAVGWLLAELIAGNVAQVAEAAPAYQRTLVELAGRVQAMLGLTALPTARQLLAEVSLATLIAPILQGVTGFAGTAATVVVYVVFLLIEQGSFAAKLARLFPDPQRRRTVERALERIGGQVQTYIAIKTAMSLLTATLSYAVMAWVGLDFAGFWAVLVFALNYIPYIGFVLSVALPTLLAVVQFQEPGPALTVLAGVAAAQAVVENAIEPRLMGHSMNLSPLVILISLAIWGSLWGVPGMILSVPIAASLLVVFANFPTTRPIAVLMSRDGDLDDGPAGGNAA